MDKIGSILDSINVDWAINEETGLHLISAQEYTDDLLTDISTQTRCPMNSLDYGTFYVICPEKDCKSAMERMKALGYSINLKTNEKPIYNKPEFGGDLVSEVAEILNAEKLFKQFGKALSVLGEQLGYGPLQNKLTERGISWRMGDDGDSIIFQVKNDVTGTPQPIARISKESLSSQNEFQNYLEMMLDLAMGDPPGTLKQRQERMRDQQTMIQDVSRVVFPNDKSSQIASLMLSDE